MDKNFRDMINDATRASRLLDSDTLRLARQLDEIGRPARQISELARNPFYEELRRTEEARKAMMGSFSGLTDLQARMGIVDQMAALRLPQISPAALESLNGLGQLSTAGIALQKAFQPTSFATQALASQLAEVTNWHRHFEGIGAWSADLELRMGRIDIDWAIPDRLAVSGLAFASLAHFSDVVRYDAPFSEETNEIVLDELGLVIEDPADSTEEREAQYDIAGREPSLVAFPEEGYSHVAVASGFQLIFPAAPIPQPIENGHGIVIMDDIHHVAMRDIENHLRHFVVLKLSSEEPKWEKRRVPGPMRQKWVERQDADRDLGNPVYALIYYSDLGDLGQLIAQGNNWPLFEPFFGPRDGLLVSLSRLTPIRNTIAHGRPLSQTDILSIMAEGQRLLRALGKLVLN